MPLMGLDSLKSNLTNPARTYLWEVLIPVPIGDGDVTTYTVRAQSAEIPGRSNGEITIPFKQTAGIKVAGKLKYDQSWAITFIEGEDKKVLDAVSSWQQKIVHNVTGIGVGDPFYKRLGFRMLVRLHYRMLTMVRLPTRSHSPLILGKRRNLCQG